MDITCQNDEKHTLIYFATSTIKLFDDLANSNNNVIKKSSSNNNNKGFHVIKINNGFRIKIMSDNNNNNGFHNKITLINIPWEIHI